MTFRSPTPSSLPVATRRRFLAGTASLLAAPAFAQGGRPAAGPITVAQVCDVSTGAQDVTKDFLIGARAAWQDVNARGGIRGRRVQHVVLETDGRPASLRQAWQQVRDDPSCVVLCGTAGDAAASALASVLQEDNAGIAHAAPWLQDASAAPDARTFAIFSGRQEQIAHALETLTVSGVTEVGAVFATAREATMYREDVGRAAAAARLRLATFGGDGELLRLGQRLGPATPAILLFLGGTPELVQFAQGLERQSRQRYVVALADVNLQTVQQLGGGRTTPIIATQAVPMVTAAAPVVRQYRDVMARLFDEPPAALSLAGFIAAQYTREVLARIDGPLQRASVLAAFQRRQDIDLGGYPVAYRGRLRAGGFVTQSMLTPDGRVIG